MTGSRVAAGWQKKRQGQQAALWARKRWGKGHLREGKGYQGTTNHYKVQKVPQVAEIRALVENQA